MFGILSLEIVFLKWISIVKSVKDHFSLKSKFRVHIVFKENFKKYEEKKQYNFTKQDKS